jgi:hypothetical protein
MDNNCCRASVEREHIMSLSLDQWVKDEQVVTVLYPSTVSKGLITLGFELERSS